MVVEFRRYTNLAATLHLLKSRKITLLNPATWDDRNDAYFMAEYKRLKRAQTVLSLCFAEQNEMYHHWRVFAHGVNGVSIIFDKGKLLSAFAKDQSIVHRRVSYKTLGNIRQLKRVPLENLPFMKRYSYRDECEYRIVYVNQKENHEYKEYDIELSWIKRINASPWLSQGLFKSLKDTINSIEGCSALKVGRSTLIDNQTWKSLTAMVDV